jgi:tetratricopeptide (TPR) repeat protein
MSARRRVSVIVTAALMTFAGSARAQSIRVADSLLNVGALGRAESIYYAAARARPRDPLARWALGRFLVARGAPRVGATLFEEALQFGGDPSLIAADLAPAYLSLGMYHELAALPSPSISAAERERARWLDAHPTRLVSPDSMFVVSYKPTPASRYLGRIGIRVNGRTIDAAIDPRVRGIVVSDTGAIMRSLRHFDETDATSRPAWKLAAADSISIGGLAYRNVPIAAQSLADNAQAIVGFDVLARLAPTFDPRAGRITVRVSGTVMSPVANADVFATLLTPSDFRVLQSRGWISASDPPMQRTLSERRWTFDARRGQLIVER